MALQSSVRFNVDSIYLVVISCSVKLARYTPEDFFCLSLQIL